MGEETTNQLNKVQDNVLDTSGTMDKRTTDAINDVNGHLAGLIAATNFFVSSLDDTSAVGLSIAVPEIATLKPDRPDTTAIEQRVEEEPPTDFVPNIGAVGYVNTPSFLVDTPTTDIPDAPQFVRPADADKPLILEPTMPADITDDRPANLFIGRYNIPSPVGINIPAFGETVPAHNLTPPTQQFNYAEPLFSLALKDNVTTKINTDVVNGGTGLATDVETAIFDRTKERDKLVLDESVQREIDEWSERSFPLPDGVIKEQVNRLNIEHNNNRLTLSREIQKLQADLAQNNTQFAVTSGLNLTQQEFLHAENVNNRTLKAAESVIAFSISLYEVQVTDMNLRLERVKTQAVRIGSLMEAERLKLENYRNELLEAEAKGNRDKDNIANYTAQVNSFNSKVGLFDTRNQAIKSEVAIQGLKLENHRNLIQDHQARIAVENAKFAGHTAEVEGELGKVRVYEAQTRAYSSQLDGIKTANDVAISRLNNFIQRERMLLDSHVANINKWRDKTGLATSQLNFETDMFGKDIDNFRTELSRETAQAELNVQTSINTQRLDIENAKIKTEIAKADLQGVISAASIRAEASKGLANVFVAQLTAFAGALQGIISMESKGEVTTAE